MFGCPQSECVWQQAITCCSCYGMPQNAFIPPYNPFPRYFLQLQQWGHLYCFAVLGSTSIVIHSVKQRLLRIRPGSDFSRLLARKITKGIHSCNSLNRPVAMWGLSSAIISSLHNSMHPPSRNGNTFSEDLYNYLILSIRHFVG